MIAGMRVLFRRFGALPLLLLAAAAVASPDKPEFSFPDSDGKVHTRAEWSGKRAVVLLFLATDCPLSNAYVPELNRINSTYAPRGVAFYAVQGDATVMVDEVHKHVKEFAYAFPYLLDAKESLAAFTGATTTPEAAVLSATGGLLYLGRIDNRVEDFGKQRVRITEFDLRDTLDAILDGRPIPHARTKAFGCAITRKD
jgi:thiol-disulfide isomerase/thioredoxin